MFQCSAQLHNIVLNIVLSLKVLQCSVFNLAVFQHAVLSIIVFQCMLLSQTLVFQ